MTEPAQPPKEIERKFLLKERLTPELLKNWGQRKRITQGYLSKDEDKVIRIRVVDDPLNFENRGYFTVKGKTEGISRVEIETLIQSAVARQLLETFGGNVIDKTRYDIHVGKHKWEIDQFHGVNEGLWVAEIELSSEDEEFEMPSFVGKEVTDDPKYANVNLANHPYKDW